ncbi:hypothetical protein K432DRAFT_471679 [Lepidopterella palustris CBS 459.81]|uniref:Hypervirulence associated protein TUDOR domain-containing protein n=1 Tax=Lepidopterella palustris CBS 459.81 TaxID=1314670 RepID=A0A8E2JHW1_9PEZI|nr:hypothetical protein K432DRAFT_471679 [Lepidopterella palustris CBS 459.81]
MPEYEQGEVVRYKAVGGPNSNTAESTGTVKKVITEPGMLAGKNVQASEKEPRYEIQNSNTGKSMAVYEKNIMGLKSDEEAS